MIDMIDASVRLHGVRIRRGDRRVIEDAGFAVGRGEVVALMGPSGSGKTTILRAIAALDPIEAGTIVVDEVTMSSGGLSHDLMRRIRRRVGMVFQFHGLFDHMTALKNVWLALVHVHGRDRATAEREARTMLQSLAVDHRASAYPHELSGGEAQRVAIARALVVDPTVLLLDEPTASLDADRRAELAELLKNLAGRARAILLTTHDEGFADVAASRVLRVGGGRVSEDCP